MAIGSNIIKVFIIIFCFFSFSANAQFTEQDCLGAIPICSQEYIPYHSGVEFNDFVPPLSSAGFTFKSTKLLPQELHLQ